MNNSIGAPNVVLEKPNQFPWKLYEMLQTAERRNEEHIISWINDGKAFKVHDRSLFIEEYMKKMFNQTKFKSFQRQLNLWGFERVQSGPDKGSYFHPLFIKGRRECCQQLSRVRLKGGEKHGSHDKAESKLGSPSVSSTAAETVSTTGISTFPVTVTAPSVAGGSTGSSTSPITLLGAFVDVSRPASTTTTESSSNEDSRQQQFADLIQYHASQERREMIRNAAIGLSPDMSIAVVGAPVYATARDTSKCATIDIDRQRRYQHYALPPTNQMEQQQKEEAMIDHHQRDQEGALCGQPSQIDSEHPPRRRSTSSGLEALLSVTAQRRREEELAILESLSKNGAVSHTG